MQNFNTYRISIDGFGWVELLVDHTEGITIFEGVLG